MLPLQEDIIREAQTMKSYHHPSVLPLHTSFIVGQDLYMITPFCEGGSILHIMKYKAKEVSTTGDCPKGQPGGASSPIG